MNLEEKVEECSLNKWGRRFRKLAFPLILTTALACGKKKKTILGPDEEPVQDKQEIVLTSLNTNRQGETFFTDNQTKEKVEIQLNDSLTNQPINCSAPVDYLDSKNFKTFYIDTSEYYLPATNVFSHNSKHIINLGRIARGFFTSQLLKTEQEHKAFYFWQSELTNSWKNYEYIKTISNEERLELRNQEFAIFNIAGAIGTALTGVKLPLNLSLSDIAKTLFPEQENMPKKWDLYKIEHGSKTFNGKKITFGANSYDVVPSNIPILESIDYKIEDNKVILSWLGSDKTTYDLKFFYKTQNAPKQDLTVLLGSTPNPDLTYFYKILRDGIIVKQDSTSKTNLTLNNLADGNYSLEVLVRDEVGNESHTLVKNFEIEPAKLFDGTIAFMGNYHIPYYASQIGILHNNGNIDYFNFDENKIKSDLAFSPDGEQIAVILDYCLYIMNRDGTNLHKIYDSSSVYDIDWGINNKLLLDTDDGTWKINLDGSEKLKLIPRGEYYGNSYSDSFWSYDCSEIYYLKRIITEDPLNKKFYICSMFPDGTNKNEISLISDNKDTHLWVTSSCNDELLYTKYKNFDWVSELWIFNTFDGSNIKIKEVEPIFHGNNVGMVRGSEFIENGNKILYCFDNNLYLIDRDTNNNYFLFKTGKYNFEEGDWTPYEF